MKSVTVFYSDPEIMSGEPVFVGTRVPVRTLLNYIEEGSSIDGQEYMDFPYYMPGGTFIADGTNWHMVDLFMFPF